jgi:hypothetical protein
MQLLSMVIPFNNFYQVQQKSSKENRSNLCYYQLIVDDLLSLFQVGVHLYDAYLDRCINVHVLLLFTVSDLRGLYKLANRTTAPAKIGACNNCDSVGVHVKSCNTTIYPFHHW